MNKEQLIKMGLTEEQADKVMESLDGNFVTKKRFDEVNTTNKQLKDDLKNRDQQLEELKKVDAAGLQAKIDQLQADNKAAKEKFEADLKQVQIDNAIEKALVASKAKNTATVKPLLDLKNVELDGETIKGLEDQLKKLKEADDTKFLFDAEEPNKPGFKGFKPGEKKDGKPGGEKPQSLADAVQMHFEKQK